MALTITVTKKSVQKIETGYFIITLNMVASEGGEEKINKDFPQHYHSGQAPSVLVAKWKAEMSAEIAKYKAEQNIYNAAALNNAVATLNTNLAG